MTKVQSKDMEAITSELLSKGTVKLDIGTFKLIKRKPQMVRLAIHDVGKIVQSKPYSFISFKASRAFKSRIN